MNKIDELIQQGIAQAKAGKKSEAQKLFFQVVKQEPQNARAWYFLSQVVEDREQAKYCLEKVLQIDPRNERVKQLIQKLQSEDTEEKPVIHPAQPLPILQSLQGNNGLLISMVGLILIGIVIVGFVLLSSNNKITPNDVLDAFIAAGLETGEVRDMTKDDFGPAPLADEGIRFYIPSLCDDCGGRIMYYQDSSQLAQAERYYTEMGKLSAILFSWVFVRGNILVQINGDLPEDKARQYESALMGIK